MLENTNQISKTASAKAKPFIKWVGGKSQLVEKIKMLISSQGGGEMQKIRRTNDWWRCYIF